MFEGGGCKRPVASAYTVFIPGFGGIDLVLGEQWGRMFPSPPYPSSPQFSATL